MASEVFRAITTGRKARAKTKIPSIGRQPRPGESVQAARPGVRASPQAGAGGTARPPDAAAGPGTPGGAGGVESVGPWGGSVSDHHARFADQMFDRFPQGMGPSRFLNAGVF